MLYNSNLQEFTQEELDLLCNILNKYSENIVIYTVQRLQSVKRILLLAILHENKRKIVLDFSAEFFETVWLKVNKYFK
jgi:hypothetical protein